MTAREPLTPEERCLADALGDWRVGEPSAALDRAILAQARAAATGRSRHRRGRPIFVGLATAAMLVLAVGVVWRTMEAPETALYEPPAWPVMDAGPAAAPAAPAGSTRSAGDVGPVSPENLALESGQPTAGERAGARMQRVAPAPAPADASGIEAPVEAPAEAAAAPSSGPAAGSRAPQPSATSRERAGESSRREFSPTTSAPPSPQLERSAARPLPTEPPAASTPPPAAPAVPAAPPGPFTAPAVVPQVAPPVPAPPAPVAAPAEVPLAPPAPPAAPPPLPEIAADADEAGSGHQTAPAAADPASETETEPDDFTSGLVRARELLKKGDRPAALAVLADLRRAFPDRPLPPELAALLDGQDRR